MRRTLLSALATLALALPASAQYIDGILVEPRQPTTSDPIRLTVVQPGGCPLALSAPVYEISTGTVVLRAGFTPCPHPPPNPPQARDTFEIGPLPAGQRFAEVRIDGFRTIAWRELIEVSPDTGRLGLGEDERFQVRVHWTNPRDGASGTAHPLRLARDSGAFWFFSPDNLEVTVKVLDGRVVNGRYWVFIASMTDLQVEIEITNGENGPVKTYVQTAGANRNFVDIDAFGEGPPPPAAELKTPAISIQPERPTPADPVRVEVAVLNTEPDIAYEGMEGNRLFFNYFTYAYPAGEPFPEEERFTAEAAAGPLEPGVYAVDVLLDREHSFGRTFEVTEPSAGIHLGEPGEDRFDIEVSYRLPGQTTFASAPGVPLTRNAGYFYFFDRENAEVTFKVLDGRAVNKRWWVFLANMTTVELEIEVTHCPPQAPPAYCITRTYVQPPGQNRNFLDTSTFFGEL